MQYVKSSTDSQYLIFDKPTDTVSASVLEFTSYGVDFNVAVASTVDEGDSVKVYFTLDEEQSELFGSKVAVKVRWGSAFDYVYGVLPGHNVVQYVNE